jgi:hypothetical protein
MGHLDIDEGVALKYIFKKCGMQERRLILLANKPLSLVRQETFLLTE